jgi:hypothetical protein
VDKDGYHKCTIKYDDRGNLIEKAYFNAAGKPTLCRQGMHKKVFRCDERGNQIDVAYFDEAGGPVQTRAVIKRVLPGSQAARVGLQAGDVVLQYDGEAIRNGFHAGTVVPRRAGEKGRKIPLHIRRAGQGMTLSLLPGRIGVEWEDRVVPEGK